MSEEPKITVLVSDLGNVLLPLDPSRAHRALAAASRPGVDVRAVVARAARELGIGRGLSSPEQFYTRLTQDLGLQMDFETFRVTWCDIFWEDPEALALIRQARVRRRYLLTNTERMHWEWFCAHHPRLLEPFDAAFASHQCGLEKPGAAIFRLVADTSGEPLDAHLFVDDIQENVDGAIAAGMQGFLFRGAGSLRAELRRRRLLDE